MEEALGLYIHVPFCRKKCRHCGFFSIDTSKYTVEFLDALQTEMELYSEVFKKVDTVYIGGGTPSFIGADAINFILDKVFDLFSVQEDSEITIECNPEDITSDFVNSISSSSINRIVLGLQSLLDSKLELLGRTYKSEIAKRALQIIAEKDTFSLGVDLIYGTVFDTKKLWKDELDSVLSYSPKHISCYELTIEPKTPLSLVPVSEVKIDEQKFSELFLFTAEYLSAKGYLHYEVSNFAYGLDHISKHNWKYWDRKPYIGLGPSAHSFWGNVRWWNVSSLKGYLQLLEKKELPVAGREILNEDQVHLEKISLGLRTYQGIPASLIRYHGKPHTKALELERLGYIKMSKGRVFPTALGYLVSDSLPLELLS